MRRAVVPNLIALAVVAASGCGPAGPPPPPRGVLVLLVDCLRADHLAVGGSELGASPKLDALLPESVAFERAFTPASWTRPTMGSLFTGLYPSEHGLVGFRASDDGVDASVLAPEVETLAEGMRAVGYRTSLFAQQGQLSTRFGLDQGFDDYSYKMPNSRLIHRRFLRWLDEEPERPFFAWLHYIDIHLPYCPPASTYGRFGPTEGVLDPCAGWRPLRRALIRGEIEATAEDRRAWAARYAEELLALDAKIGVLFTELRERGLWDDLLIVVTADHGEELLERGSVGHGHTLHEELLHVPFVWKLPAGWGAARGRLVAPLVETRSLLPTLFELVGRPVPETVSAPSLLPWLLGRRGAAEPAPHLVAESNGLYSVRDARWKLILTPEAPRGQLYDLARDPGETRDLAAEHPDELERLRGVLRRWRGELRRQRAESTAVDTETVEDLRALGYLD